MATHFAKLHYESQHLFKTTRAAALTVDEEEGSLHDRPAADLFRGRRPQLPVLSATIIRRTRDARRARDAHLATKRVSGARGQLYHLRLCARDVRNQEGQLPTSRCLSRNAKLLCQPADRVAVNTRIEVHRDLSRPTPHNVSEAGQADVRAGVAHLDDEDDTGTRCSISLHALLRYHSVRRT